LLLREFAEDAFTDFAGGFVAIFDIEDAGGTGALS
jgi:hypothetical protein